MKAVYGLLALTLLFYSCTLQKRHYRKGFYVGHRAPHPAVPAPLKNQPSSHLAQDRLPSKSEDVIIAGAHSHPSFISTPVIFRSEKTRGLTGLTVSDTSAVTLIGEEKKAGGSSPKRKLEPWGMVAFAISIGAWFSTGYVTLPLFVLGAILAIVSLNIMGQAPERYVLKTLSLVALILCVIGAAVALYELILILLAS